MENKNIDLANDLLEIINREINLTLEERKDLMIRFYYYMIDALKESENFLIKTETNKEENTITWSYKFEITPNQKPEENETN